MCVGAPAQKHTILLELLLGIKFSFQIAVNNDVDLKISLEKSIKSFYSNLYLYGKFVIL